jgi:hypothetical protein
VKDNVEPKVRMLGDEEVKEVAQEMAPNAKGDEIILETWGLEPTDWIKVGKSLGRCDKSKSFKSLSNREVNVSTYCVDWEMDGQVGTFCAKFQWKVNGNYPMPQEVKTKEDWIAYRARRCNLDAVIKLRHRLADKVKLEEEGKKEQEEEQKKDKKQKREADKAAPVKSPVTKKPKKEEEGGAAAAEVPMDVSDQLVDKWKGKGDMERKIKSLEGKLAKAEKDKDTLKTKLEAKEETVTKADGEKDTWKQLSDVYARELEELRKEKAAWKEKEKEYEKLKTDVLMLTGQLSVYEKQHSPSVHPK